GDGGRGAGEGGGGGLDPGRHRPPRQVRGYRRAADRPPRRGARGARPDPRAPLAHSGNRTRAGRALGCDGRVTGHPVPTPRRSSTNGYFSRTSPTRRGSTSTMAPAPSPRGSPKGP